MDNKSGIVCAAFLNVLKTFCSLRYLSPQNGEGTNSTA